MRVASWAAVMHRPASHERRATGNERKGPMTDLTAQLLDLERRLDPADPGRAGTGVELLAYGEVSGVLGCTDLPGRVLKRMSGFPSREHARAYADVVGRYVAALRDLGVPVVSTEIVPLESTPRRHVVYVVQPRLDGQRFGHSLLRSRRLDEIFPLLGQILELVRQVLDANARRADGREIAIDAQLSNWHWAAPAADQPRLGFVDVATPFMRKDGVLEMGVDLFLAAYPAPVRWWLRRTRAVERYIADYFRFDLAATDLIGNFIKEGAPEKIPGAAAFVREWIARQPDRDRLGHIDEKSAQAYYAKDAADLELSLRARRLSRFVTAKILRRRYDFILPGRIAR